MTFLYKTSVIMTVYNGEKFLQETLDSVWAQTFTDFELVVVNNGSTDDTQAILDGSDDPRLRVVQAPKHGTFGEGIRLAYQNAKGQYIAVQDADDVPLIDRFEKQVAALDADSSLGIVCGGFEEVDVDGHHLSLMHPPSTHQELIDTFQNTNPLAHSTYMYRRVAADQVQGYPVEYAYGPDFGLVIRMLKKGWKIKVLDDVVLKQRIHGGQASVVAQFNVMRSHDALYLYGEAVKLDGVSPLARRLGARNLVKCRLLYAMALMADGRMLDGSWQMFLGLLRNPLYTMVYLGYRFCRSLGLFKDVRAVVS